MGGAPDGPYGAARQDVHIAISDILRSYALDSVMRASSVSHFIGIAVDRRSPRGVRILGGEDMPCIPEDLPLAWCAPESIRSERDCWKESIKIALLLDPREMVAFDLSCRRQRQKLRGTPLLSHAKHSLLGRRTADIKKKRFVKRIVPVGLVADDGWMDGHQATTFKL